MQLQMGHLLVQEERDILLTADIGGTNCRFSLWAANIRVDVVYDEIFTKVRTTILLLTPMTLHIEGWSTNFDANAHMPCVHADPEG